MDEDNLIDTMTIPAEGLIISVDQKYVNNNVVFQLNNEDPILELRKNGDIFVKGKLVENDKEVVDGLREFLEGVNCYG